MILEQRLKMKKLGAHDSEAVILHVGLLLQTQISPAFLTNHLCSILTLDGIPEPLDFPLLNQTAK